MSENTFLRCEALSPFNGEWVELHAHPLQGGGIVVRFHLLQNSPLHPVQDPAEHDDKEMLLEEVIHRVKNNFQMIISLLDLQYIQASNAEARAIISDTRDRVQAVALAHKKLCELPTYRDIELGEYLEELTRILDSTYCPANTNITLKFDFDRMKIDSNRAMTCGLLVNEAVTNCLKHAFQDCESGEIQVTLKRDQSDIVISICDNGGGIPTEKLHCEPPSLGLRLMRLLAGQLHGQIDWKSSSSGSTVTLRFPEQS
jgi:two-component sensor histidine kinase